MNEDRTWREFTEKEMKSACSDFQTNFLVPWMDKHNILCGSCDGYNLYVAIRDALEGEYYKAHEAYRKAMEEEELAKKELGWT